jgi:uncharacterized membrane protein YqaE (UPF0057 family)
VLIAFVGISLGVMKEQRLKNLLFELLSYLLGIIFKEKSQVGKEKRENE